MTFLTVDIIIHPLPDQVYVRLNDDLCQGFGNDGLVETYIEDQSLVKEIGARNVV